MSEETPNAESTTDDNTQIIPPEEITSQLQELVEESADKESPPEFAENVGEITGRKAEQVIVDDVVAKQDFGGYATEWAQRKAQKNKERSKKNRFPAETMKMNKIAVINEGRAIVIRCRKVGINADALEKAIAETVKQFD